MPRLCRLWPGWGCPVPSPTATDRRAARDGRIATRQQRRQRMFVTRLGTAHRPTDRLGVAVDYLRGALADAPAVHADREVDALVRQITEVVARLHGRPR